jgi:hypothetical protein
VSRDVVILCNGGFEFYVGDGVLSRMSVSLLIFKWCTNVSGLSVSVSVLPMMDFKMDGFS